MLAALQVVSAILVAVAMALALAHALELPGKLRLSEEQYLAVQPIYYPGFTIGGLCEPLSLLFLVLLLLLSSEDAAFWLTAGAFASMLAMHAAYWLLTHPVNNFWLKDVQPQGLGGSFFSFDPLSRIDDAGKLDWIVLRNRWEFSHAIRAGFGLLGLILLVSAIAAG
jgi:hypothetical protein